jgi:hypothetical protein
MVAPQDDQHVLFGEPPAGTLRRFNRYVTCAHYERMVKQVQQSQKETMLLKNARGRLRLKMPFRSRR